jgi:hypothetical protein
VCSHAQGDSFYQAENDLKRPFNSHPDQSKKIQRPN